MAWYAVYKIADGALVSVGSVIEPATLPADLTFTPLAEKPNLATQVWDTVTHTFIPRVSTKDEIERALLQPQYLDWIRWKDTLAEATARGIPAQYITALTNKTNAAWADYIAAIQSWYSA